MTTEFDVHSAAKALDLPPDRAAEILDRLSAAGVQVRPDRNAETAQERRVGALVAEGYENKRIAYALGMSEATVKVHIKSLLRKAGVTNRTQYAIWAKTGVRPASAPGGEIERLRREGVLPPAENGCGNG